MTTKELLGLMRFWGLDRLDPFGSSVLVVFPSQELYLPPLGTLLVTAWPSRGAELRSIDRHALHLEETLKNLICKQEKDGNGRWCRMEKVCITLKPFKTQKPKKKRKRWMGKTRYPKPNNAAACPGGSNVFGALQGSCADLAWLPPKRSQVERVFVFFGKETFLWWGNQIFVDQLDVFISNYCATISLLDSWIEVKPHQWPHHVWNDPIWQVARCCLFLLMKPSLWQETRCEPISLGSSTIVCEKSKMDQHYRWRTMHLYAFIVGGILYNFAVVSRLWMLSVLFCFLSQKLDRWNQSSRTRMRNPRQLLDNQTVNSISSCFSRKKLCKMFEWTPQSFLKHSYNMQTLFAPLCSFELACHCLWHNVEPKISPKACENYIDINWGRSKQKNGEVS